MRKDTNIIATNNGNANGSRSRMRKRLLRAAVSFSLIVSLCVALPSSVLKVEAAGNDQTVALENQAGFDAEPVEETPCIAVEENDTNPEKPTLANADGTYVWTGEKISVINAPNIDSTKYAVMLKKDGTEIKEDDYGAKGISVDAETGMISVTEIGKYEAVFNLQDGFTWRDSETESDTAPVFFAFEVEAVSAACPDSETCEYVGSEQTTYADFETDTVTAMDGNVAGSNLNSHTVTLADIVFEEQYEDDKGYIEQAAAASLSGVAGNTVTGKSCTAETGQLVTGLLDLGTNDRLKKYKLSYVTIEWEKDGSTESFRVDSENISISKLNNDAPVYNFSFEMPDGDVTVTPHLDFLRVSVSMYVSVLARIYGCEDSTIAYTVSIRTADDDGEGQELGKAKVESKITNGKMANARVPLPDVSAAFGNKFRVFIQADDSSVAGNAYIASAYNVEYNYTYSDPANNLAVYDLTISDSFFQRTEKSDDVSVDIRILGNWKIPCHIKYGNETGGELLFFYSPFESPHTTKSLAKLRTFTEDGDEYFSAACTQIYVKPDEGYYLKSIAYATNEDGTDKKSLQNIEGMYLEKIFDGGNYYVYSMPVPDEGDDNCIWIFPEFEKISTFADRISGMEYDGSDVVKIINAEGLEKLSELTNQGVQESDFALNEFCGITFKLNQDISLEECGNWRPISWNNKFHGNFDGCGHTISGMYIENSEPYDDSGIYPEYIGLFGATRGGYIRNLTVEGKIELNAGVKYVGGIAASVWELTDCTSRVDITTNCNVGYVGGMTYWAHSLSGCKNYGNITLDAHLCGLNPDTGESYPAPNRGSLSDAEFCPVRSVGGIAAKVSSAEDVITVKNCGNYGKIDITESWRHTSDSQSEGRLFEWSWACVGGIVGTCHMDGLTFDNQTYNPREIGGTVQISGCVNRGKITGDFMWGGGILGISCGEKTIVENCVNAAPILEDAIGNDNKTACIMDVRLGGIVGTTARSNKGGKDYLLELSNCYNACTVTCTRTSGSVYVGELHGNGEEQLAYDTGSGVTTVENCHYGTVPDSDIPKYLAVQDDEGKTVFSNAFFPIIHAWEQELAKADTSLHNITFEAEQGNGVKGTEYTVTLYKDADYSILAGESVSADFGEEVTFSDMKPGAYYYTVSSESCVTERGNVPLIIVDNSVSVLMTGAVKVQFEVSPADADFALNRNSKEVQCSDKQTADGHTVYTYDGLYADSLYRYDAKADGYGSVAKAMLTGEEESVVRVKLEVVKSTVSADTVIPGTNYYITQGGAYSLPAGTYHSNIYINTSQDVTLVGAGIALSDKCANVSVICQETGGVNLTLQDVYLSNPNGKANMIDFKGTGNILNFAGTNVLEQDTGASGYAMIHVPEDSELSIRGGAAYLYKSEQGAGIGGNGNGVDGSLAGEVNGTICFEGATIFMKGTKQGAVIGSGANSYTVNGGKGKTITIKNSTLNLIANARGAAIGGGAGSAGGYGCDVKIENSTVNINVNYTGAAIGGAGSDSKNDKDGGGYVSVSNSSLRTYISANMAESWGVTDAMEAAGSANGIVSLKAINNRFAIENSRLFDVSGILQQAGTDTFEVYGRTADQKEALLYSGGPQYRYVSEVDPGISNGDTLSNWVEVSDDYLLYLDEGYDEYVVVAGGSTYLLNEETENVEKYGTIQPTARYGMNRVELYQEFPHQSKSTIVQAATCTQSGKRTNVCEVCGVEEMEEIPALGHSYSTPTYTWKKFGAGYTCTAKKVCSRCGDIVQKTVTAKVTSKKAATTSASGSVVYTAEFTGDGFTTKTKEDSLPKLAVTKPAKPGKVSSFQLKSTAAASQKLSWKAVKGATGYRIIRYSSAGKKQKTYTVKKTSLTVTKLKAATTYKYRISAYAKNTKGTTYGTASKYLTVSTAPAKVTVSKPAIKTSGSSATLTVKWKKGKGNGYQIQYSTDKKFKKSIRSYTVKSIKTTSKKLAVKKNKKYYIRVRAYRTLNKKKYYGAWSAVKLAG